jgi:hypothetical protein
LSTCAQKQRRCERKLRAFEMRMSLIVGQSLRVGFEYMDWQTPFSNGELWVIDHTSPATLGLNITRYVVPRYVGIVCRVGLESGQGLLWWGFGILLMGGALGKIIWDQVMSSETKWDQVRSSETPTSCHPIQLLLASYVYANKSEWGIALTGYVVTGF